MNYPGGAGICGGGDRAATVYQTKKEPSPEETSITRQELLECSASRTGTPLEDQTFHALDPLAVLTSQKALVAVMGGEGVFLRAPAGIRPG